MLSSLVVGKPQIGAFLPPTDDPDPNPPPQPPTLTLVSQPY